MHFLGALTNTPYQHPNPIWLMRQAGRYLPEYRAIRAHFPSFIDFCFDPDAATEVTLQPITRFDVDAAIIFADILTIPHVMGHPVTFTPNHGPNLPKIKTPAEVEKLKQYLPDISHNLSTVGKTIQLTRKALHPRKAVIGFSGAAFTLATYMLDDKPSQGIPNTLRWMADQPEALKTLFSILEQAIISYLSMQIESGANAVQIFDSWAGACPEKSSSIYITASLKYIVAELRRKHPTIPVIVFARGVSEQTLISLKDTLKTPLGLSTEVDITWASQTLQPHVPLQGNLDPLLLVGNDTTALDRAINHIKNTAGLQQNLVWNVGHGVTPETNINLVHHLIDKIRN